MYFSRIFLDNNATAATRSVHAQLRHGLHNTGYRHHQLLWRFFPNRPDDPRDFMFRFMEAENRFYLLSPHQPVAPDAGWQVESKPYSPVVYEGMQLRFELRANPVITHKRDGKSKRDDVVMHTKKLLMQEYGVTQWQDIAEESRPPLYELVDTAGRSWLNKAAQRCGFFVEQESLRVEGYLQHRLRVGERDIRFSTLDFSGVLTIADPEIFKARALNAAIGHAKAFGCGLLLVRPV